MCEQRVGSFYKALIDIQAFKGLRLDTRTGQLEKHSPFREFKWELDVLYKTTIHEINSGRGIIGFYGRLHKWAISYVPHICIIPKGSIFCLTKEYSIVSNQMQIKKEVLWLDEKFVADIYAKDWFSFTNDFEQVKFVGVPLSIATPIPKEQEHFINQIPLEGF